VDLPGRGRDGGRSLPAGGYRRPGLRGEDVITSGITRLAQDALAEAHVVVFMVERPRRLHRRGRGDRRPHPHPGQARDPGGEQAGRHERAEPRTGFYDLGFEDLFLVSSAHGAGAPELLAAIRERLPLPPQPRGGGLPAPEEELRFAIIGGPTWARAR